MRDGGDGFIKLAMAVMLKAMRDAKRGDAAAREWLYSTGCSWLETIVGEAIEIENFESFIGGVVIEKSGGKEGER